MEGRPVEIPACRAEGCCSDGQQGSAPMKNLAQQDRFLLGGLIGMRSRIVLPFSQV
jgi:hypothetical protein